MSPPVDDRTDPVPAEKWPDRPLDEAEARDLLGEVSDRRYPATDGPVTAVWVMNHDPATRAAVLDADAPGDAVIEVVLETPEAFHMYSYAAVDGDPEWTDYGAEIKGTAGAEQMAATLGSYRVLAGGSDLD